MALQGSKKFRMSIVNNVVITGRVANIHRRNVNGAKMINLLIVQSKSKYNKETREYESTNELWFDCEVWEKAAEYAERVVKKGIAITIEGKLCSSKWTDKATGEERSKVYIRATMIHPQEYIADDPTPHGSEADDGEDDAPWI